MPSPSFDDIPKKSLSKTSTLEKSALVPENNFAEDFLGATRVANRKETPRSAMRACSIRPPDRRTFWGLNLQIREGKLVVQVQNRMSGYDVAVFKRENLPTSHETKKTS